MEIAVLGTGNVGRTIASKLVSLGHRVTLGSRTAGNAAASAWAQAEGPLAHHGTYADAARRGELVFNCTAGVGSLDALTAAGAQALEGKTLIDVANPLDFSHGMPPTLTPVGNDSLGEQLQRAFPQTHVVKALNTINCEVMVEPGRVSGEHHIFICGDHQGAKTQVTALLHDFGWPPGSILDLGDISAARGTEGYLLLWLRLWQAMGTGDLNIKVVR